MRPAASMAGWFDLEAGEQHDASAEATPCEAHDMSPWEVPAQVWWHKLSTQIDSLSTQEERITYIWLLVVLVLVKAAVALFGRH